MSDTEILVLAGAIVAVVVSVIVVRGMRAAAAPAAPPPRRQLRQPPPRRVERDEVDELWEAQHDDDEGLILPSDGLVQVVGESFFQPELARAAGGHSEDGHELECIVGLFRQPDNPHDPNAVVVWALGAGQVGYLSREDAATYQGVLLLANSNGLMLASRAQIRGGWDHGFGDRGHFGVVLHLARPEACFQAVLEAIQRRAGGETSRGPATG